jgi:hypothetical protein
MQRLQAQLTGFEAALCAPSAGVTVSQSSIAEVAAFLRGIERKSCFVAMHMSVLSGVHWDRVESVGRRPQGQSLPNHLTIPLADASLTIEHAGAVVDHVYVAFDGLMAAIVNMTDTMSRLINARYGAGIAQRQASLLSLKGACTTTSPLGTVINDPLHTGWLLKVRDLRGRCQHADIESVLVAAEGPYARRGQPVIPPYYYWKSPQRALPILDYAQEAAQAAEDTLLAVVTAVVSAPTNPLI